jgi:hypothetical protein
MPVFRDPDDNLIVVFKNLAIPNEAKSVNEGRPIFDDVESCEIRVPGSRDYKVFPATAFSHWEEDPITGAQKKVSYAERFSRQYQQFKAKNAQTVTGTPLEYAQFLTEGRRAELRAQNVYTVEILANIDGIELRNLGPGGREMKNKAIKFIEEAKASAPDKRMVAEIEALRARNAVLEEDNATMRGNKMSAAGGAFDDMSDDQLRAYVVEHTGKEPHGTLPRKTLIRMAAEATPSRAA